MNFNLTEDQKKIIEKARKFARDEFPKVARECDREEKYPMELWKKAAEQGFMGTFISSDYGGSGLGYLEHDMVMEEFWRVDPGLGNILLSVFGAEIIETFGTEPQKEKYLPLIAGGKVISGCAVTEPDAGSDIFAMRTEAKKKGQEYVVNGNKQFITNGSIADFLLVMCVTNPEAEKRTRRYSILLVETDQDGFSAEKLKGKMGIRASDTAAVFFDNVAVPVDNLIGGQEGEGFQQIMYLFNINRTIAAAQGVGVAQGVLDLTVAHLKKRIQFGKPLATFQAIQFKIADMAARIESARALYHKAAWMIDHGQFDPKLVAFS